MGVIDLIRDRRSIREYIERDIPYEDILEILEAARWAPSSGNLQNWYFVIVKNRDAIEKIAKATRQEFVKNSNTIIVVCSDDKLVESLYGDRGKMYAIQNVAAAIQNMLLVATEKGIGTCWVGDFDEDEIKSIIEAPKDISIHAIITLGYYSKKPEPPKRKSLDEIVFFEKWGNKTYKPSLYPLIEWLRGELSKIKKLKP